MSDRPPASHGLWRWARRIGCATLGLIGAACAAFLVFATTGAGFRHDDLDLLDPGFRRKAVALLDDAAAAAGTDWVAIETARYAWRQDALYAVTKSSRGHLLLTKVPATRACHVAKRGWHGARAIDVRPRGNDHRFYLYLRDHAKARGVRSGAGFGSPAPGRLGWDPGHLELPGCTKAQTPE